MQARGSIDPSRETGWGFSFDAWGADRLLKADISINGPTASSLRPICGHSAPIVAYPTLAVRSSATCANLGPLR
jgi:hypothetical protein